MNFAYQTIETAAPKPRTAATALQLAAVFGPAGLLYVSAPGALIIAVTAFLIGPLSWPAAIAFAWSASMIWSLVSVGPANDHIEQSRGLTSKIVLEGDRLSSASGAASRDEVRHRLGAPDSDEDGSGGGGTWTYSLCGNALTAETLLAFASLFPRAGNEEGKAALSVRFDADGEIAAIALQTGERG